MGSSFNTEAKMATLIGHANTPHIRQISHPASGSMQPLMGPETYSLTSSRRTSRCKVEAKRFKVGNGIRSAVPV
jgi:hypothetical protein